MFELNKTFLSLSKPRLFVSSAEANGFCQTPRYSFYLNR